MKLFNDFIKDESGATAIEYGLIAALVSVAAIAALQSLGGSLSTMFTNVSDTLENVAPEDNGGGNNGGGGNDTQAPTT